MLVERHEGAERERRQPLEQQERRRAVARHLLVGDELLRDTGRPQLVGGAPEGEGLRLRERVRQQEVVVPAERVGGRGERDDVAGTSAVPWWSSWWKLCWPFVPGSPQTIPAVSIPTGAPATVTRLPFDSITSCCR